MGSNPTADEMADIRRGVLGVLTAAMDYDTDGLIAVMRDHDPGELLVGLAGFTRGVMETAGELAGLTPAEVLDIARRRLLEDTPEAGVT